MISSAEYKIFVLIDQDRTDEIQDFDTLSHMHKKGYVAYTGAKLLYITQKGQRAYEEYKHFLEKEDRENHTLQLAKEANAIAKDSNSISNKSNKLSKIAIAVSAFAVIVSIVGIVLSAVIR